MATLDQQLGDASHPLSLIATLKIHTQYRSHWVIVLLFDIVSFMNAILWISFTPINKYYGVSSASIDLLSTIFMILFFPGLILCAYSTHKFGLRITCVSTSTLNFLGALLRYLSVSSDREPRSGGYVYALCGQILGGLAQPISISLPGRIATIWLADHQRNLAIVLLSLTNVLGVAVGQILPSVFVDADSGMPDLQLVVLIMTISSLVSCAIWFKEAPPTPPTAHADLAAQSPPTDALQHVVSNVRAMMGSPSFLELCLGFGLGMGVFNILLTKIEAIVSVDGFTPDDAGTFGAICMIAGFVGSGVFGMAMDATHAYRRILRICLCSSFILLELLFFALSNTGSFVIISAVFAGLGFFLLPLMPIFPEEMSTGLMMLIGNVTGFIGTIATDNYVETSFIPSVSIGNLILSVLYLIAILSLLCAHPPEQSFVPMQQLLR